MNFRALKLIDKTAFFLIVIAFLFTIIFPFYWIMLSSFTPKYELFTVPPRYWFSTFTLENYQTLANSIPLLRYFINSLLFAAGSSFISVAAAFLASYALARLQFRGANFIFIAFVMSIALPQVGGLVLYLRFSRRQI